MYMISKGRAGRNPARNFELPTRSITPQISKIHSENHIMASISTTSATGMPVSCLLGAQRPGFFCRKRKILTSQLRTPSLAHSTECSNLLQSVCCMVSPTKQR